MSKNHRSARLVRILTANLYADRLHLGAFRDLLEDLQPDVAAVQELSYPAAEVLGGFLPHGVLAPEAGYSGRGLALTAPARTETLPMAHRDGLIALLDPPIWPASLEIVNVHMANPIMWPPWRSLRMRSRQLEALKRHISRPRTRIVAGDFNASPVWPAYRHLAARLDDVAVLAARKRGERPSPTWGPIQRGPRVLRIDHVFVEGLLPLDARVVAIPGSDHRGLLVDVGVG